MANAVQSIPDDITDQRELIRVINDRLRRLDEAVGSSSLKLSGDLDAAGFRIMNLGGPNALNDAITQAAARRLSSKPSSSLSVQEQDLLGIEVRPVHF